MIAKAPKQRQKRSALAPTPPRLPLPRIEANTNPTPFTWTKTADQIVEKVQRGRVTLNAITN